ncbi:MAG: hypothetical protein IJH07_10415, partial [Ruminococcus sp.]|nr:hypothetical protein [Ruminococcus sp.]
YFRPNYDGNDDWYEKVLYVAAQTPDEPTDAPVEPTDAPVEPTDAPVEPTDAPAEGAYYVVGNMTDWNVSDTFKLAKNDASEAEEYIISLALDTDSQFKIVYSADGEAKTAWYPDGFGNNYGENGEITADGTYDVYFRPNGDGGDDWFYSVIYVALKEEPTLGPDEPTDAPVEPTEPATWEKGYYLTGTIANWGLKEGMMLTDEGEGLYSFGPITLTTSDMVKVVDVNKKGTNIGNWYPDGMDNNQTVAEDGEYMVYFRPAGDGTAEDGWNYIYYIGDGSEDDQHHGCTRGGYMFKFEKVGDIEPTDAPVEPTDTPVEPTDAPVGSDKFYLVGTMNDWEVNNDYELFRNTSAEGFEYALKLDLAADAQFKIVKFDGVNKTWYPDGYDNNYVVEADGTYTVYFRPNGDGGEDWFYNCIYVAAETPVEPTDAPVEPTDAPVEPTDAPVEPTDAPVVTSDYFLVGSMNDWEIDDAYNLTKNTAAEAEEYSIKVDLTTESQFKIVKLEGTKITWYPTGMGNNYGENGEITANGAYTVYFRPNYDGGEDWFNGVIYAALETPVEPTDAPVEPTDAPVEPTDAPVEPTEAPTPDGYYVVGSFTDWGVVAENKLSKNDAAETEEYSITMTLSESDQFKVVYSADGAETTTWFPGGYDNYVVTEDGTYDIYFRPNYDGGEDWFKSVIYAAAQTPVEPTEPPVDFKYGDADGDGKVTVMDVTMIQRVLAKMEVSGYNAAAADVDGDGKVTSMDATYIQRAMAKMALPENVRVDY